MLERSWNVVVVGAGGTGSAVLPSLARLHHAMLELGHPGGIEFWSQFISALRASGYTGTLSIEHEDLALPPIDGVRRSVDLLRAAVTTQPAA